MLDSVLWLLYLLLISVVAAFVAYALLFRKEKLQDPTPAQKKIEYLKQHVPPNSLSGWELKSVDSGLRVWQKNMENRSPSWVPGTIYACSAIIPATQQEVINVLKQPGLMTEWDPTVNAVSMVTMATHHNVISVSFNCTCVIARVVHQIRESFAGEINSIYSRHWEIATKPATSEAWLMSSFIEQVIPAEGALWSCFLVSSIDNGDDEETDSLVTLITAPASPLFASIPQLTASRVAGLQDFVTHYKPDASPVKSCESQASEATTLPSSTSDDHAYLVENKMISSSLEKSGDTGDDSYLPDFASSQSIDNLLQKLNAVYEGTEGSDGWITVGNIKGVNILKRPANAGERPFDCLKGTSLISVPIKYILAYIYSMDFRGEWDDLFLKGEIVEHCDPITKVCRMEYKPVWPASGRDFCNLVILRQISEGVFCVACEAVENENCPEQKGLVRGELIIAGFVVKELSSDPPSCLVTYITQADLKGNLPARIVNRVTSSQPQAVAVLRVKLEALYQADMTSNSQSQIQKEGDDLWLELMKAKEPRLKRVEEEAECDERDLSLVEKHIENDSSQSFSDTGSKLEESNISDSGEIFPITEENMQLPFVDRHNIDFKTLGSQAVANLLGEVLLANQVEIPKKEFIELVTTQREWSYQSTEKDVVIYRKISPGEKVNSFMGKGMIKVEPPAVWQAVRNHMTRHVYDKMLKKFQLVRQIDDQSRIIYLHHEAKQCIVKQSRDFLLLESERIESGKYILAAVSVQLPELTPTKDIVRAKVYTAGWIIEPVLQNGQLYSMVTYLVQADFRGAVPAMLMNLVARRQPLCVAYLREYLEELQN